MSLTPDQQRFWQRYLDASGRTVELAGATVVAGPAGEPTISDHLIDLYLAGTKTAGSGLAEDYVSAGDPLPRPGDHWIALGGHGEPRCILRTERVETHRFLDVPERIAVAEGEGDLSLDHWRAAHAEHFAPDLARWGLTAVEDATVVTEFFTLVHPAAAQPASPGHEAPAGA